MKRCRHVWKLVDKQILPSPIEQLAAAGATDVKNVHDAFDKPVIAHYRCASCGTEELKRL